MSKTKLFKPENTLKKKVGQGGFKDSDIQKAQSSIDSNVIDFRPIALDFLKEIENIILKCYTENIDNSKHFPDLMHPLMQLCAQGSLFKYPSITAVSDILVDFLDGIGHLDKEILNIVEAYKNALKVILSMEIKEADHTVTKQLCKELIAVSQRYKKSKNKK